MQIQSTFTHLTLFPLRNWPIKHAIERKSKDNELVTWKVGEEYEKPEENSGIEQWHGSVWERFDRMESELKMDEKKERMKENGRWWILLSGLGKSEWGV